MKSYLQKWDDQGKFKEFDQTGHAKCSPSKFHRLANCPFSSKYDEEVSDNDDYEVNQTTLTGTMAHKLAATKLIYGWDAEEVKEVEDEIKQMDLDTDLDSINEDVNDYVSYVFSLIDDYSIVRIEEMLDMSQWIKGVFGTCDAMVINPNNYTIVDFKYGFKPVEAEENEQLLAYAVGAIQALDINCPPETITMVIYQPRAIGKTIKTWTIDFDTLRDYATRIKRGIEKIDQATIFDRQVGPWCEYCKNKVCPLKIQYISELLQIDTAKEYLTDTEIYGLQANKRAAIRLLNNFYDDVMQMYEDGEIMQDYTMEYSNGRKTWTDENKVREILIKSGMLDTFNIPSPAQLERKYPSFIEENGLNEYINQTKKKSGFNLQ